ncbi:UNKNOWN [Stylonychia lemnae]|uniref:Uncharacterized protein n=1 Tax=Stylonychia lemnae TaxID=5949 RepID=A0A078A3L3_STYLE|nr:UNKNOWN [Stylonychia lemnae]|eukprot:CDW76772.1 UNKNOWN [Stylonychia lemnae]
MNNSSSTFSHRKRNQSHSYGAVDYQNIDPNSAYFQNLQDIVKNKQTLNVPKQAEIKSRRQLTQGNHSSLQNKKSSIANYDSQKLQSQNCSLTYDTSKQGRGAVNRQNSNRLKNMNNSFVNDQVNRHPSNNNVASTLYTSLNYDQNDVYIDSHNSPKFIKNTQHLQIRPRVSQGISIVQRGFENKTSLTSSHDKVKNSFEIQNEGKLSQFKVSRGSGYQSRTQKNQQTDLSLNQTMTQANMASQSKSLSKRIKGIINEKIDEYQNTKHGQKMQDFKLRRAKTNQFQRGYQSTLQTNQSDHQTRAVTTDPNEPTQITMNSIFQPYPDMSLNNIKAQLQFKNKHKKSISDFTRLENNNDLHKSLNDLSSDVFAQKQRLLLSPDKRKEQQMLRILQVDNGIDSTDLILNTNMEIKKAYQCLDRLVKNNDQKLVLQNSEYSVKGQLNKQRSKKDFKQSSAQGQQQAIQSAIFDPDNFQLQGKTRKQLHMDLQKKIALFLNDYGKRQEFFNYLQEIKHKLQGQLENPDDINKHLNKNLELAQVWLQYQQERRNMLSQYNTYKKERAEERRKSAERQQREYKLQQANRWVIFRENQEKFKIQQAKLNIEMQRKIKWITKLAGHQIIRKIYEKYNDRKTEYIIRQRQNWVARMVQRNMKKLLKKMAPTRQLRVVNTIRQQGQIEMLIHYPRTFCLTVQGKFDGVLEEAKNKMLLFMRQFTKKSSIKFTFIQYCEKLISIQNRFLQVINLNKARIVLLKRYYEEVHQKVLMDVIKKKKDKVKLTKLQNINPEIRDAVLNRYYNKCRIKHASAFFNWRKKRQLVRVKRSIETIINLRRRDQYIDEAQKHKLLQFGVEGLVQIEEKKLKYENLPPIEELSEIEQREIIQTNYNMNYLSDSKSSQAQGAGGGQQPVSSARNKNGSGKNLIQQNLQKAVNTKSQFQQAQKQKSLQKQKTTQKSKMNLDQQNGENNNTFLTGLFGGDQEQRPKRTKDEEEFYRKLFREVRDPNIEIDESFWNPPQLRYWPSIKVMKHLINIACTTKTTLDLVF